MGGCATKHSAAEGDAPAPVEQPEAQPAAAAGTKHEDSGVKEEGAEVASAGCGGDGGIGEKEKEQGTLAVDENRRRSLGSLFKDEDVEEITRQSETDEIFVSETAKPLSLEEKEEVEGPEFTEEPAQGRTGEQRTTEAIKPQQEEMEGLVDLKATGETVQQKAEEQHISETINPLPLEKEEVVDFNATEEQTIEEAEPEPKTIEVISKATQEEASVPSSATTSEVAVVNAESLDSNLKQEEVPAAKVESLVSSVGVRQEGDVQEVDEVDV